MAANTASASRTDRRKERTRAALLAAGRQFLADGRTTVSIQEITAAADVGFGSFYNHFEDKQALFEAAVEATLDTWMAMRDEMVAGYDDPAEVFAVSFRMLGRLQRRAPELTSALLNAGVGVLTRDHGLAPRAREDIVAATQAGRFDVPDPDAALMMTGGAMLGLLQWLETHPAADAAVLSDQAVLMVLRACGMNMRDATKLSHRPLPPQPET